MVEIFQPSEDVVATNITVGVTTITSGTDKRVLFDDNGVLGEDAGLTFNKTTDKLNVGGNVEAVGSVFSKTALVIEETGAGTDTITIQAPASIAASYTLTLPVDDGTTGQFMQTNGSGVLAFSDAPAGTPAGTTGDVQFNTSGAFDADTGVFFYDKTNHRSGFGTNTPDAQGQFHIAGVTLTPPSFSLAIQGGYTSIYFNGQTVTYRAYSYAVFLGVQYFSSTYTEHSIVIPADGDTPSLEFGSGGNGDGIVILRDIDGGGYNDATLFGPSGTFVDDSSQPWSYPTTITPTSRFIDTRANYNDGTTTFGLHTTSNGYVGGSLGLGITPTVKFEVLGSNATIPTMGLPYESAAFFNLDNKVGIYSNQTSLAGNGSSITFGEAYATNGLGQYPGFEIQNVNGSTTATSYMRFNSLGRDSGGNVVANRASIIKLFADGVVTTSGGNTLDNGSGGATLVSLTDSALTSGRVVLVGASGLLTDDSDFTFATDTLTVTKIAATTFTGNVTLSTKNIVTDTTTGTKIGTGTTQKLGFFNATPIVQVPNTTEIGVALSNLGLRAAGTAYPITTSGAVTLGSLTAGRVVIAGTAGLLADDADMTFATDTLTVTKLIAPTSVTSPLHIGGTTTTSTLTLQSTSGVGTTNADIIFKVGNNGATEAMRILNSGYVGIGTNNPASNLTLFQSGSGAAAGFRFTGNSIGGTSSGTGFLQSLGYNAADNKQMWFGDPDYIGNSAGVFLRAVSISGITTLDAVNGDNTLVKNLILENAGGNVGIAVASPTARLHLPAGTATASTAPIKLTMAGSVALTTPEAGVMETSTDNVYLTKKTAIRESIPGVIFTQTADKSVTNTVTETSIVGTGVGTLTLPANFFVAGKTIRVMMSGVYSTVAVTGDTVTIKVKYGSTVIASQSTTSLLAGATNLFWWAEALVTCRTAGATGTVQISGSVRYQVASSAVVENELNNSAGTTTIDTTASSLFDVTVTHSAANASNSVKSLVSCFEVLN